MITFTDWWKENKALYKNAGVKKELAYNIWCAAINNYESGVIEGLLKASIG